MNKKNIMLRLNPEISNYLESAKKYMHEKVTTKAIYKCISSFEENEKYIKKLENEIDDLERTIARRKNINDNFINNFHEMMRIKESDR